MDLLYWLIICKSSREAKTAVVENAQLLRKAMMSAVGFNPTSQESGANLPINA